MRGGFSLIELMAAVAILAVVSIMAAQVLSGVILQRDILIRLDDQNTELMRALTLLRRDFEAVAPILAASESQFPIEAALLRMPEGEVRILRAGMIALSGPLLVQLGIVAWALRDGVLLRAEERGVSEAGALEFLPVLQGVSAFSVLPLVADPDMPSNPAAGYEIMLQTELWGPLRLVVVR